MQRVPCAGGGVCRGCLCAEGAVCRGCRLQRVPCAEGAVCRGCRVLRVPGAEGAVCRGCRVQLTSWGPLGQGSGSRKQRQRVPPL